MDRVFLIGDSIRQGYDRYVREKLSGRAEVYYPTDNCRFAAYTLRHMHEWIEKEVDPANVTVIHFNCGHWDTGCYMEDVNFTSLENYLDLLRRIVRKMRKLYPQAKLIFATSTPVLEHTYADPARFIRRNADVIKYNEAAVELMKSLDVAVDDLHAAASTLDESAWSDSTHLYTPIGTRVLGDAVCESILSVIGPADPERN